MLWLEWLSIRKRRYASFHLLFIMKKKKNINECCLSKYITFIARKINAHSNHGDIVPMQNVHLFTFI